MVTDEKGSVLLKFNGGTIYNADLRKLADLWADYYELLFTRSLKFDEEFKIKIEKAVDCFVRRDVLYGGILDKPVTQAPRAVDTRSGMLR